MSAESLKELASNEVPHFAHADEQLLYGFATRILRDHFVDQARSTPPWPSGARPVSLTSSAAWVTSPCSRCC